MAIKGLFWRAAPVFEDLRLGHNLEGAEEDMKYMFRRFISIS